MWSRRVVPAALSALSLAVVGSLAFLACRGDESLTSPEIAGDSAGDSTGGEPEIEAATTASAAVGSWSSTFSSPVVAVHATVLPATRVVTWGKVGSPQSWNPATRTFSSRPSPSNLFCAGHALLADGRLLVVGGHAADHVGIRNVNIYSAFTGRWASAAPMRYARWYPTATTLANGDVVVLSGEDGNKRLVPVPEVWSHGSWRSLTGASLTLPNYPRTFLAPNGRVFYAGEASKTRYLNTSGSGSWSTVGSRKVADRGYGSAVMYAPGRILYVGGGDPPTSSAEIIDLNSPSPAWQLTGSMAYRRRHHNATILPTGEVLVTGGVSGSGFNNLATGVRVAEIWNPATGDWTVVSGNSITRGYHGASVLLPDGRVLNTGSGDADGTPSQKNAEVYSPPYLFKGARPSIANAPSSVGYGESFLVATASASSIAKVSLIALGSATHAFDANQRFVSLSFSKRSDGLMVTAPSGGTIAPPGYYMLFVVNTNGVPSVGHFVRVG